MNEMSDWRPDTAVAGHQDQPETQQPTKSETAYIADLLERARSTSSELREVTERRKRLRQVASSMYAAQILTKPQYEALQKALR